MTRRSHVHGSRRRGQRGITLVELVVSMVLTGIIAAAVTMFVVNTLQTYSSASIRAELLAGAQTAMDRINSDIILSASADENNRVEDANSPDAGDPLGWVGDGDTLILATAAEDGDRELLFADPAQYVTHKNNVIYYLQGDTLRRRVLAADVTGNRAVTTCPDAVANAGCPADGRLLSDVETFAVTYYNHLDQAVAPENARSVEVSLTVKDKSRADTRVSYKSRTVFRND